jgi:hypothetical protein
MEQHIMTTPTATNSVEPATQLDRIREVIPRYTRDGLLRRIGLPDGGVEFVEALTDRVFAAFDGQGRLVA